MRSSHVMTGVCIPYRLGKQRRFFLIEEEGLIYRLKLLFA
jgi:hypothetical protein